jgi:LuxR family maltose regulon positive regulatory protein
MVIRQPREPQLWLAETKFHPPLLREDVISRWDLIEDLRSKAVSFPLVLLSAPAGYGKTTLLATIQPAYADLSVSWLSLDEDDNDPARFMTALIVALQQLNPEYGTTALSLLTGQTHHSVEMRRVAGVLINDILDTLLDPFVLILDDLHLITEPLNYMVLDYLLEHRPPQLHLVVAGRVDPPLALARLRARGEVAELRLGELGFDYEETRAFLNDRLQLDLSDGELDLFQSHTEGWPVGLRLLASSLDQVSVTEDRMLFLQHLANTDRDIFHFLTEEVFNHQVGEIRNFLLETATLTELTPRLCQAVTQRADAGAMLEELYRHNLFLVKLSPFKRQTDLQLHEPSLRESRLEIKSPEPEPRYRYHDLFATFLAKKLRNERPDLVAELHVRAAQAESDPARAVVHYLAAARWSEAADLIVQIGAELFTRGQLKILSRWINMLPTEVLESHPRLLHFLSNCAFLQGDWDDMQTLLGRALKGFESVGDETGQGEVLANLAMCAAALGEMEHCRALFDQALKFPIPAHTQVQALLGRVLADGSSKDWAQIERDFNAAMAIIQQSDELDLIHVITFPFFHPGFAFIPGGLEQLESLCRRARAQVDDRISPSRLMVEEMTTILHLFRGQLAEAIRIGQNALALRERLGGHPYLSLDAALYLMIAHAARGDFAAVEPLFNQLFLGVDLTIQPPPDLPTYLFYAGRVRWLQGRLQEAREIYGQMCAHIESGPLGAVEEILICRIWMWSLLEMAGGRYAEAERALRQPMVLEQKDRDSTMHGSTRLMLARLYWQQNRQQEALAELALVLDFHEKLGIPFPFLLEGQSIVPLLRLAVEENVFGNYARHLLGLLDMDDGSHAIEVPHTGAVLTPREVEVLGFIVAGYTNRGIAEALVISEWTVKSHLTKIYRKLDVTSRTQAIARARDLGIG